ncbi:SDR family oxidoreductase [Emticicia sp. C21]|uniref:SDR family NAD(P)-dependent oxidoreductase n=1 Tax=Emticicia sp. C21 TaxID=2302915 RepID=UPI000E34ED7B|nr:SDR family oxidoreductase [Emticicia sp. C21]RFS17804.1 SDR family oxidoreductase [Emticicia sp. C21]
MKVTLLTGASSGIGEAWAKSLAAEKHNLVLVARSENKLKTLCNQSSQQYGISVQYIVIDLTQPNADLLIFEETEKRKLIVDCLINNAGIGTAGDFTQIELADEQAMMQLNMITLVSLTHRYLKQMRERNSGTIINVASMAAFMPAPFMAAYAASKVFVKSFTEALSEENRPFNIRIMLLCPGATETRFFETAKINQEDKKALLGNANIQTPAMVVEEAMKGMKSNKTIIISGLTNKIGAKLGALIPNSMIMKFIANNARSTLQKIK